MPPQYKLNLYDYFRIIRRRRYIFFFTFSLVMLSTFFYTKSQKPVYQASCVIKVDPTLMIPDATTEALGWDVIFALNTEVKVIKSAVIAEKTALSIGLIDEKTPEEKKKIIINSIQAKIDAERIGDTNLIRITAISSNKKEVALLSNVVVEVYIQKSIEEKGKTARDLRIFVGKQLEDTAQKLKEKEEKLRRYAEETSVVGIGQYIALRMMDLESKKQDLLKKYTELHPEVARINEQLKNLENTT